MALERMESEPCLIGDASTQHSLPTIDGKHSDLISIESKTVGRLLQGEYSQDYTIIGCRYPYEFDGGHIQGAMNIFTEEGIRSFLENQRASVICKRQVLVFHCEFSSKRGPKLMRLLRSLDRKENSHRYPELYYPEIYLLDGGYKAFYECNKAQCNPQAYLPMLHEDHSSDLRHFRTRSKSWTAGEKRSRSRRVAQSPY
ncbi:M-phase inducer phosphatase-like [Patella vulgata]|uniref:M-phase inducer phosphatase-like n=1 Tax=Patella vulgata TaxID=6465 RepID=UPI00217FFBDD|nr:M-phase inducer phosphatase-like [Patella vulgata]